MRYIRYMNIARYEKRIGGWLVDKAISYCVLGLAIWLFVSLLGPDFSAYLSVLLSILVSYFFFVIFNTLFLWISNGRTVGNLIFGIKVSHPSGNRLGFTESLLKSLLVGAMAMDIINSVYMLSNHTERSVFDRMTNTNVIDTRA